MYEDFRRRENIWQLEMMSVIVYFEWIDCAKTCNMSKYIEYERLKILFRKIIQPFPKTPLNRKHL